MKKDLVSIIIPVYNTEKYLNKCLESVIKQTYKKLEIIVVNDGSTDNSLSIINKFSKKDKRIVVIDQKNSGVSKARNAAMDIAKGDFISFVDSDDSIEKNFIEELLYNLKKYNADICECNMKRIDLETNDETTFGLKDQFLDSNYSIKYNYVSLDNSYDFIANKIFKREIIGKDRFSTFIVSEDFEFLVRLYEKVNKKITISKPLYNYVVYPRNYEVNSFSKKHIDIVNSRIKVFKFYDIKKQYELCNIVAVQILSRIISIYKKTNKETQMILKKEYNNYYKFALKAKTTFIKRIYRFIRFTYYKFTI